MANDVAINGGQATAKVRSPWLVLLFGVLTFGVYFLFWWYFANREMADLGRARKADGLGDAPGLSLFAYIVGGIVVIPSIWTTVTTTRRVQRAQRLTIGGAFNGWAAAVLIVLTFGFATPVYLQHQLNKVWRSRGMRPVDPEDAERGEAQLRAKLDELLQAGAIRAAEHQAEKARLGLN
jgi:Domain of unknown function (DUF4234)